MKSRVTVIVAAALLPTLASSAQDPTAALDESVRAMGGTSLRSLQYSGTGSSFALGQSPNALAPWPRFNVTSFTALVDYETASMRQETVRTQGERPPHGGGGQPLIGDQRQVQFVSGGRAWNVAGDTITPAPSSVDERGLQIWITPHGVLKAAIANHAVVRPQAVGNRSMTAVSFVANGRLKIGALINEQHLVERVDTWLDNPVLGDMLIRTSYSGYKDFGGVRFPTRIVQQQGGFPTLDLTITAVQPNRAAAIETPASVEQAAPVSVRVESQQMADGIWYLTGGSHHSVAVEFKDHVVVIEGPQNEERSLAVMTAVRKAIPSKAIRYLVNTHQHFDHAGGIRTYAAEGVTIITHQMYESYYEKVFAEPRTLNPDLLAQSKKAVVIEPMTDKRVLSDGARTLELHLIRGNAHNDGILMAFLPKEKILIEADVFSPGPASAPPPAVPNPFSVNLYDNIRRLKLDVRQILPIHGRAVTVDDLRMAIGRAAGTQE